MEKIREIDLILLDKPDFLNVMVSFLINNLIVMVTEVCIWNLGRIKPFWDYIPHDSFLLPTVSIAALIVTIILFRGDIIAQPFVYKLLQNFFEVCHIGQRD